MDGATREQRDHEALCPRAMKANDKAILLFGVTAAGWEINHGVFGAEL